MSAFRVLLFSLTVLGWTVSLAQKTCTSNPTTINTNINFGSITWTAGGGATTAECNDMADGLITFTGNVLVDLANNKDITITNDVNIIGSFPISGGPGSLLRVNGGFTLHVTGDLGDAANNGVQYEVTTADDHIIVDGTLYGKNNNAFTGDGTITGGTLDVKNGTSCGSPCPVAGGFENCTDPQSFCEDNGVLPIKLLSFNATKTKESVTLYWKTTLEEDFDHFVVEHSTDGFQFSEIGTVPGAGRNVYDIITEYSFEDRYPLRGLNYYRLKSVDLDLHYDYSRIVSASIEDGRRFWVHPNPVSESLSYFTNFPPAEGDRIVLLNPLGKQIFDKPAVFHQEAIQFDEKLSPGIYFLKYYSNGVEYTSRVLIR